MWAGCTWTSVLLAGPLLGAALAVGLLIGIFQAATQPGMTLSFIPKLLALVLRYFWRLRMIQVLVTFSQRLITSIPGLIGEVAAMPVDQLEIWRWVRSLVSVGDADGRAGIWCWHSERGYAWLAALLSALMAPMLPINPDIEFFSAPGI